MHCVLVGLSLDHLSCQLLSSFACCCQFSMRACKLFLNHPLFLQPQMDEKIQLGPRAQVTWVKGSSGGAKASDSGKETCIN